MTSASEISSPRETFAELYEEYLPKVFRYVRYRVNELQVAEDLTSTTFEKALVNFEKYSADRAAFSTWVFSIARNVVIDHYRVRGRRPTSDRPAGSPARATCDDRPRASVRRGRSGRSAGRSRLP